MTDKATPKTELPDALRVPMDELEADAAYLMGRAAADPSCAGAMAESVRVKIRALRAEVERLAAQAAPTEPGGDVEQDGFRLMSVNAGFTELLEALDRADRKGYMPDAIYSAYEGFECRDPASTVAALKARVAELEKDAARLEFVCNSPNRMVERESGLWRVYEDVAPADHPTAVWQGITPRWHVTPREAIDAAITAALTKGQP